jgi:hypothetical protein
MQPDDVIGPETAVNFQRSEGHRRVLAWAIAARINASIAGSVRVAALTRRT